MHILSNPLTPSLLRRSSTMSSEHPHTCLLGVSRNQGPGHTLPSLRVCLQRATLRNEIMSLSGTKRRPFTLTENSGFPRHSVLCCNATPCMYTWPSGPLCVAPVRLGRGGSERNTCKCAGGDAARCAWVLKSLLSEVWVHIFCQYSWKSQRLIY